MFKVGDKVKASDWFMSETWTFPLFKDLYDATVNNEEMIVKELNSRSVVVYCKSFTSTTKTRMFSKSEVQLQLSKNDGKLRFTYTEVPSGTEYSNFLAWSRRHK